MGESAKLGCQFVTKKLEFLSVCKREEQENTVRTWRPIATVSEQRVLYYTLTRTHAGGMFGSHEKIQQNSHARQLVLVHTQSLTCQTTDELILHTVQKTNQLGREE